MKLLAFLLLAFLFLKPKSLVGQKPARIIGAVADSLHGKGLSGAEITLSGTAFVTTTDSLGRFHFDNVPPGTKQVGVFHPLLDSLGISIGSKPFALGLDSIAVILLSIPSPRVLITQLCGDKRGEYGIGLITGRLFDPESAMPLRNARVSFRWTSYEIKARRLLSETPRAIVALTDSAGIFRACGLPTDVGIRMQADRGGAESPELEVTIGAVPIVLADISIARSDSRAFGVVRGIIADSAGSVIPGAYVEMQGLGVSAFTDATGEFLFDAVATGTQIVVARKIGYAPIAFPTVVGPKHPVRVSYRMTRYVPALDKISIRGRVNSGLDRIGFTRRDHADVGNFITAEDIRKQGATRLSEILRRVPGLRIDKEAGQPVLRSSRGTKSTIDQGCLRLMLDGTEWLLSSAGEIDNIVQAAKIAAIEIYNPLDVPGDYTAAQKCTTILVWTKFNAQSKHLHK